MKKVIFAAASLLSVGAFGQNLPVSEQFVLNYGAAEAAPEMSNSPMNGAKVLWDIQFSADVTTASNGSNGQAAVAFFNNEIWTSKWASDTIIRFTNTGTLISKFVIAGLSGTRAITTDGVNLYMVNNTNTIYVVNPGTQTVSTTITSAAALTSRFLTYDPTLNSGAGGFWTGNFNTDIVAISMTGAVLSIIPASTHTLTGMYGAAVDNVTSGGPYLWVFHQGGTNSTQMTGVQLPGGTPTVYTRDVYTDVSVTYSLSSGLAGGAFFSSAFVPGQNSLMGLVQGTPNNVLVVYDTEITSAVEDVAVTSLRSTEGYTKIPLSQVFSETFEIGYQNLSTVTVPTLSADVEYYYNGGLLSSETVSANNVATGATGSFTTAPFAIANGIGSYEVRVNVYPDASLTDSNDANDTLTFMFQVTDSIFARDNGVSTGAGYNVSTTDSAYAVSLFEVMAQDTVTGVWIRLEAPIDGDSTFGLIYMYNGTLPTTEVARGTLNIISSSQNIYYLQFDGGVVLNAGTYGFGCYEGVGTTIGLSQSNSVYTAGTNYFQVAGGAWTPSNIQTARFIRPVFGHLEDGTGGLGENDLAGLTVYPVPATDLVNIAFGEQSSENGSIRILDMNGRVVAEKAVPAGTSSEAMNVQHIEGGTYLLHVVLGNSATVRKLVIR